MNALARYIDWQAIHDRLVLVATELSQRHVCTDFPHATVLADAAPVLAYAKARAAGAADGDAEGATHGERLVLAFAAKYGQSLDWIIDGDLAGMICRAAAAEFGPDGFTRAKLAGYADIAGPAPGGGARPALRVVK